MQRVVFRTWRGEGEVVAMFLDQPQGPGMCSTYSRVEGHKRGLHPHPLMRAARPVEWRPVWKELQRQGWKDLKVVKQGRIAA